MGLTFKIGRKASGQHIRFAVFKNGYHIPFTQGVCFNAKHAQATKERFQAWASQGWPYIVKDLDK